MSNNLVIIDGNLYEPSNTTISIKRLSNNSVRIDAPFVAVNSEFYEHKCPECGEEHIARIQESKSNAPSQPAPKPEGDKHE